MSDPRPICPIPPDAKVGDVVIALYGPNEEIRYIDESIVDTVGYAYNWDGTCPGVDNRCVGFIYADGRKPNLPKKSDGQAFLESVEESDGSFPYRDKFNTAKPKRTQAQRDAAYLRKVVKDWNEQHQLGKFSVKRMLAIADRLEGKT